MPVEFDNRIGRRLSRVIDRLSGKAAQRSFVNTPATAYVDWAAAVSAKGSSEAYRNTAPVSAYTDEAPWIDFDGVMLEKSLPKYVAADPYPLPGAGDREGYHGERHYDYWLSGLKDYLCIKQTLAAHGVALRRPFALLDFGSASGRVVRHFLCHETDLDLWCADLNMRHVEWIRRFLAPSIKAFQNSALPYLPLEDNSLSLIYAFSVFTHIDDFELAWVAELRRVLKPGGLAYLTIHSERTWRRLAATQGVYHHLLDLREHIVGYDVTPEFLKSPMPSERTVLRWKLASTNNATLFHSTDYIKHAWGRFFEVLDIVDEGHNYQDVVVLRKP